MNYIWELLLKADKQNIPREDLKFVKAEIYSPYIELAFEQINLTSLPENNTIEVNECYRFYEIFKDLFNINFRESKELRDVLLDILLHYLGELDLKQGLNKLEIYKEFLYKDILNNVLGEKPAKNIIYFNQEERNAFLNAVITLYRTGVSLELFKKILRKIFKNSIVYSNKEQPKRIYIYLNEVNTKEREKKINIIVDTFLSIDMKLFIFWDNHFGILGIDNTMKNGEIVMID